MRTVGITAMAVAVAAVAITTTHATDAAVIPISSFTGPIPPDSSAIASLPAMPDAAPGLPAMPAAATIGAIPIITTNGVAPAATTAIAPPGTTTPTATTWPPPAGTLQSTTVMSTPALLTRASSSSGSREQAATAGILAPRPIATAAASTGTTISSKPSTLLAIQTTKPPGTTGPVSRRTTARPITTSRGSSASGSGSGSGAFSTLNGGGSDMSEQGMDASLSYACVCKDVRKVSLMSAADYCLLPAAVIGDKCGNAAVGEKGECPKTGAQPCQDTGHVLTNDSICAYDKRDETYKCVASKEDLYIQKYGTKKKKSNRTSANVPKSITSSAMALPQDGLTRWVLLVASLVVGLVAVV